MNVTIEYIEKLSAFLKWVSEHHRDDNDFITNTILAFKPFWNLTAIQTVVPNATIFIPYNLAADLASIAGEHGHKYAHFNNQF